MAWAKLGTTTLASDGDDLDLTTITSNKFIQVLYHSLITGGNGGGEGTFNNNSNSVYATRRSSNGGSDYTATSQSLFYWVGGNYNSDGFAICYVCNISAQEKLIIKFNLTCTTTGAGTAPDREEQVLKFVPSPDADITRIDSNNTGTGNFLTGSNISALGTD